MAHLQVEQEGPGGGQQLIAAPPSAHLLSLGSNFFGIIMPPGSCLPSPSCPSRNRMPEIEYFHIWSTSPLDQQCR